MLSREELTPLSDWWWTVDRPMLGAILALMLSGIVLSLAAAIGLMWRDHPVLITVYGQSEQECLQPIRLAYNVINKIEHPAD